MYMCLHKFYQPAMCFKRGQLFLRLLRIFRVCLYVYIYLCVRTYHTHNNYVTYIVAMRPYFSWHWQFRRLLCVGIMSSLVQLWVWDWYWEAEAMKMWRHKADWERKCQKRAATRGAYRVANLCATENGCQESSWVGRWGVTYPTKNVSIDWEAHTPTSWMTDTIVQPHMQCIKCSALGVTTVLSQFRE